MSAYSPVTVTANTLLGRRRDPSRGDFGNFPAGRTLPRRTPFMSGMKHSISVIPRSSTHRVSSSIVASEITDCRNLSIGIPGEPVNRQAT